MRQATRVDPKLPVGAMQTFQVLAPKATHFRQATCAEIDCPHYLHGWRTTIDESTELGQQQAWYVRNQSGRRFTEDRDQAPGLTTFTFEAGQRCFGQHQVRLDKPELFIVRDGDWRGNPSGRRRQHANADDWVDDFANHQDKLARELEKG